MKRVLITGSRDYTNMDLLYAELDALRRQIGDFILIEGGATGADRYGRQWARQRHLPVATVEADWKGYGKGGGRTRNGWMLGLEPHYCVAFPLPGSVGTYDCIRQVAAAQVPYKVVGF